MIAVNWSKVHSYPFLYEVSDDKEPRLLREKEFCKLLNLRRHFIPTTSFDDFCVEVAKLEWLAEAAEDMISDAFRQVDYYEYTAANSELRKLKLIYAVVMAVVLSDIPKTEEVVGRLNSAFRTFTKDLGTDGNRGWEIDGKDAMVYVTGPAFQNQFLEKTGVGIDDAVENLFSWYNEKISQHVPKPNKQV